MNKELKNLERKWRVLKLHAVIKAYSEFTIMEANRVLLNHDNSWKTAEKTKDLIEFLFPGREVKTEDFIYEKDKLSDKVLDMYAEYKRWIPLLEIYGVPAMTLKSFCKNVNRTSSIWTLKTFGHMYYPLYLNAIYGYLEGKVSKDELKSSFVECSLFDGKTRPVQSTQLRRTIIKIERLIDEIMKKQATRCGMSVSEFIAVGRLPNVKLANMSFLK